MERAYDNVDGIKEYLKDLDGLNRLKKDRMEAGYERKERLQDFLILGRWMTDSCGNFGDCTLQDDRYKPLPDSVAAGMPPVVPRDDIFKLFHVHSTSTSGMRCSVPPVHVHCRECGQKWVVSNAHDAVLDTETVKVDLAPYLGRTFRDLDADMRRKTDGHHFISSDLPLRHDRFIDLTPHPSIDGMVKNKNGWVDWTKENPADWDYAFRDGDETYAHAVYYTHGHCHKLRKSRDSREYYVKLFLEAGLPEPVTREVPNERCQDKCCMPWIVGQFPFGDVKIGWRSSVISIDWSGFPGKPDYESLFDGEETSKSAHYVHAHGREKAVEYLRRLKSAVDAGLKCDRDQCPSPPTRFYHLDGVGLECLCRSHDVTVSSSRKRLTFFEAVVQKVHET